MHSLHYHRLDKIKQAHKSHTEMVFSFSKAFFCFSLSFFCLYFFTLYFVKHALHEMDILLVSKWNQYPCCQTLTWNQQCKLFRPEIYVFELTRCMKWKFSMASKWNQHPCYQTWNQHFWAYTLHEMNIFLASKWNQHPCCPALKRNQQFKLLRPEIDVLEHTPCMKLTCR